MTWDAATDALLVDAATECGLGNWSLVATLMGESYDEKVVHTRFQTLLSRQEEKRAWTSTDREKLKLAQAVYGPRAWANIAAVLQRTARDCAEQQRQPKRQRKASAKVKAE